MLSLTGEEEDDSKPRPNGFWNPELDNMKGKANLSSSQIKKKHTLAPSFASLSAIALPIPREEPVTMQTGFSARHEAFEHFEGFSETI